MDITTFRMFFACGAGARPISQTFSSSGTLVIPAGVLSVDLIGRGARGRDSYQQTQDSYTYYDEITIYPWNGSAPFTVRGSSGSGNGQAPGNSCGPYTPPNAQTQTNGNMVCTYYSGSTSTVTVPATTGASSTGVGKTFPGSYGDITPTITQFNAVPVTAGSYNIVVPAGGYITVNYLG